MKFSKKLIALRHAKGLSQQQLGEALKVPAETINSWEIGLSTPDLEQLSKLAIFFSLPLETLIKGVDSHQLSIPMVQTDAVTDAPAIDPERHRVITQLEILSGTLAAICLLGTVVYLVFGIF